VAKKVIFILVILMFFLPASVLAQEEPALPTVAVDLWPEFDRPSMLVIYHITLPAQVDLPFQMDLRIPSAAGTPHAVAVRQPDGSLVTVPYKQQAASNWTRIVFQATTPEVQLEYYDPSLIKEDNQRRYEYTWPGDYAVTDLNLEIQQPEGGSDLQVKPGMVTARQGSDGLTYYQMNVGSLSKGQQFAIMLSYHKESDDLSVSALSVEPSAPIDNSTTGRAGMTSVLPTTAIVILGVLGLLLIVGGVVWYWQSGRERPKPAREGRGRRKPAAPVISEESDNSHIYCHQCGKRAMPGDRFCRACGTPLRIN
jgi:hypothetical protein